MSDTRPPRRKSNGRPFTKGDPRTKLGGRPKKSVKWEEAEQELREALPRVMLMKKHDLSKLLSDNPTGAEMLAAKFLVESPNKAVERFLGKMPQVLTGAEGAPLIPAAPAPIIPPMSFQGWTPAQIDKFIEATAAGPTKGPQPQPAAKT